MKAPRLNIDASAIMVLAALVGGGYVVYRASKLAVDLAPHLDPTSTDNVFYSGANDIGGALSGEGDDFSLGVWIYEITHPNEG